MDLHSKALPALLLSMTTAAIASDASYTGNPGSPYPPSCITEPLQHLDLTGDNAALFFSDRIWLETAYGVESSDPMANLGEVQLDMYRLACAEPNRSVIVAEFSLPPEWVDPRKSQLVLPWLGGNTGFDPYPLTFKPEANSWGQSPEQFHFTSRAIGDYTGGWDNPRRFRWRYVLDTHPQWGTDDRDDAPKYYNGAFSVLFYRGDGEHFMTVAVPSTRELLEPAAALPLSGRLSGNWVERGSADQGLLISFGTPIAPAGGATPPEDSKLLIFLSWFTFDAHGEPLWLTGSARFSQGSSEVIVPIELVVGGSFLGDRPALRSTVGSVRLRAIECNRLELRYRLDELGLGRDTMRLERLYALEIADYPCRDYEGLQSSIYPPETN